MDPDTLKKTNSQNSTHSGSSQNLIVKTKPEAHRLLWYDFSIHYDKFKDLEEEILILMKNFHKISNYQYKKPKKIEDSPFRVFIKRRSNCNDGLAEILIRCVVKGLTSKEIITTLNSNELSQGETCRHLRNIHHTLASKKHIVDPNSTCDAINKTTRGSSMAQSKLFYTISQPFGFFWGRLNTSVTHMRQISNGSLISITKDSMNIQSRKLKNSDQDTDLKSSNNSKLPEKYLISSHSLVSMTVDLDQLGHTMSTIGLVSKPETLSKYVKIRGETSILAQSWTERDCIQSKLDDHKVLFGTRDKMHEDRKSLKTIIYYHTKIDLGGWIPWRVKVQSFQYSLPKMLREALELCYLQNAKNKPHIDLKFRTETNK